MKTVINLKKIKDRRSGHDRRQFSYTVHIPERRNNGDRRSGKDRRKNEKRRNVVVQNIKELWSDITG